MSDSEIKELKELLRRVLEHFDMEQGDHPSLTIWHLGERRWGIVEDELAELLSLVWDLVQEEDSDEPQE